MTEVIEKSPERIDIDGIHDRLRFQLPPDMPYMNHRNVDIKLFIEDWRYAQTGTPTLYAVTAAVVSIRDSIIIIDMKPHDIIQDMPEVKLRLELEHNMPVPDMPEGITVSKKTTLKYTWDKN